MARLRLFGPARQAAGASCVDVSGQDISKIIAVAEAQFGERFSQILAVSSVWLNGEAVEMDARVADDDEIAVMPPVSGG